MGNSPEGLRGLKVRYGLLTTIRLRKKKKKYDRLERENQ
jgi:hypothetical protein